ncbi:dicarboxylate/amino acid:cation symporter [Stakelama tenebrarum]|uniref:Dicarboxylate/amino acid:cation symporter n=1 Tax=Stakelama tenebrarum TaxID=2711215 RepID=A0A6G6Y3U0_9SPHN|nr:dicarboxylate/amino acid:cation symporter [Sphingosinithalassobacter tenebrarum]QIG79570.1 dicarboxylate/amino acid:cation symporter [Sphingosinithalassobacter tenebrarum]
MAHSLESIHPRSIKMLTHELRFLIRSRLWAQILLGMALGVVAGLMLSPSSGWVSADTGEVIANWISLPGELFLVLIKMVIVPLVIASVVRGIAASGDAQQLRSTGIGLAIYFVATTLLAIAIGLFIGYLFQPGIYVDPAVGQALSQGAPPPVEAADTGPPTLAALPQSIVALLPQNPLSAVVEGDLLQVVILGVILGIALVSMAPNSAKPLLDLMGSIQQVSMHIVTLVMTVAPLAVFGLLARAMMQTGPGVLVGVGVYAGSVILALLLLLAVYLVIVAVLGRRKPFRFLRNIRDAQLLAFSTDSSAATMPVSVRVAEEKLKVRPSTAQIVIPIGATMNMGGTACYHGIATIFMAQLFAIDLGPAQILAVMMTSLGASIGAPAAPGVGIMVLSGVLASAGIPLAGLTLIIGLDQVLERVRCVMNVTGDLAACIVVDRFGGGKMTRDQEIFRDEHLEAEREWANADVLTTDDGRG